MDNNEITDIHSAVLKHEENIASEIDKDIDNKISDLDLSWNSINENKTHDYVENVNDSKLELCQINSTDISSTLRSTEEQKEQMDFGDFTWSCEENHIDENSTEKKVKNEIGDLQINHGIDENKSLIIKKSEFGDSTAFGLFGLPADIPYNDIPSRYSKPIEDVLEFTAEERIEFAERKKRENERMLKEDLVAARQGRLHPSNARFNQGPVVNPPPITPGVFVGFTPAGQRYEVDLNQGRPTYFISEYSRMMYDSGTIINALRMMSSVEDGSYLPRTLDDDIERRLIAERKYVERSFENVVNTLFKDSVDKESANNVENDKIPSDSEDFEKENFKSVNFQVENIEANDLISEEDEENVDGDELQEKYFKFQETELKLLKFHRDVCLMLNDFPSECLVKIHEINNLTLKPLMFLKHPELIGLVKKLMNQNQFLDMKNAATVLYKKIEKIFNVPSTMSFEDYFDSLLNEFILQWENEKVSLQDSGFKEDFQNDFLFIKYMLNAESDSDEDSDDEDSDDEDYESDTDAIAESLEGHSNDSEKTD